MRQAKRTEQERRAAYVAYAIQNVMLDCKSEYDFQGNLVETPIATLPSDKRDGSRYEVRVYEHADGSMSAASCACVAWCEGNPHGVCCKHMEAFNAWHSRIFRSVTVMPAPECFDHEERWPEPVEISSRVSPVKQDAKERMERAALSSTVAPDWLRGLPSRQAS